MKIPIHLTMKRKKTNWIFSSIFVEKMDTNHLTINILGVSLTLKSKETPEYLKQLTQYFLRKIDEAKQNHTTADSLKILIMAGLTITDELLKEKNSRMRLSDSDVDDSELEEFTERMINKIDESLMEH